MSCPSLASLKAGAYNKPVKLPTTSDLIKLKAHTEEVMKDSKNKLQEDPQYQYWRRLAEAVKAGGIQHTTSQRAR